MDLEPGRHDRGPAADQAENNHPNAYLHAGHSRQIFDKDRRSLCGAACEEPHDRCHPVGVAGERGDSGSPGRVNGFDRPAMELSGRGVIIEDRGQSGRLGLSQ